MDIGEPAYKRRKSDTSEDQSNDKSSLLSELSTVRPFVGGNFTETSEGKETLPSEEKWRQPIIRSPRKQKGRPNVRTQK